MNSKINGTPKGVYLPFSKLQSILTVANLLAHNNIWLSCYVQANSVRLKSMVASKWAIRNHWGYRLFCCSWYHALRHLRAKDVLCKWICREIGRQWAMPFITSIGSRICLFLEIPKQPFRGHKNNNSKYSFRVKLLAFHQAIPIMNTYYITAS